MSICKILKMIFVNITYSFCSYNFLLLKYPQVYSYWVCLYCWFMHMGIFISLVILEMYSWNMGIECKISVRIKGKIQEFRMRSLQYSFNISSSSKESIWLKKFEANKSINNEPIEEPFCFKLRASWFVMTKVIHPSPVIMTSDINLVRILWWKMELIKEFPKLKKEK